MWVVRVHLCLQVSHALTVTHMLGVGAYRYYWDSPGSARSRHSTSYSKLHGSIKNLQGHLPCPQYFFYPHCSPFSLEWKLMREARNNSPMPTADVVWGEY